MEHGECGRKLMADRFEPLEVAQEEALELEEALTTLRGRLRVVAASRLTTSQWEGIEKLLPAARGAVTDGCLADVQRVNRRLIDVGAHRIRRFEEEDREAPAPPLVLERLNETIDMIPGLPENADSPTLTTDNDR
ncbi:CATRA system-associated protein [Streptomyces sp. NPDC057539]|uniref:CATRA system-associated protein n=1 Tax=Streptomyces sp. NPDC057539 TaxID=3346159 RepID=UPI0036BC259E